VGLWQDLQSAIRLLIKDKWFTLVATVALALGIGVNATVFTFVNAVLIRGLPFDEPDRILALNSHDPVRDRNMGVSYLDFKDWKAATKTFSALAAYTGTTMNVSDEGRAPEWFNGSFVSANAFKLIGQGPAIGRDFLPEDDRPGAAAVVLLGNGIWKNRYAGDAAILGRTIRVNDVPSVVIGVMPEGFKFPQNADLWQPLALIPALETQKRNSRGFEVYGRLGPNVAPGHARAELIAIGQRLMKDYPDTNKDVLPRVQTFNERANGGPIRAVFLSCQQCAHGRRLCETPRHRRASGHQWRAAGGGDDGDGRSSLLRHDRPEADSRTSVHCRRWHARRRAPSSTRVLHRCISRTRTRSAAGLC